MKAKELRAQFREYFGKQGYNEIPADTLISDIFPTCFTISGGPNFVARYLQNPNPQPENSLVVQRCHRFWDAEKVGDGRHLSAFEMAVTTSFNGYSREEMFKAHYDFLTRELGLNPDYFTVFVFGGGKCYGTEFEADEGAVKIWQKLGIDRFSIQQGFGLSPHHKRQVNASFVANTVEPVGGPRTEICYGDLEIWTSVHYNTFVDYDQETNSFKFRPIEESTIASGFGLERALTAMHGYKSIDQVFESAQGVSPVVFDHVRGLVRLAQDGAFDLTGRPNSSRRTILNRYLRNLYEHLDPRTSELLPELVRESVEIYKSETLEIVGKEEEIYSKIVQRAQRLGLEPRLPKRD